MQNQQVAPFGTNQAIHPFVMIIFGATGDLTARKLMPALYSLFEQKILPEQFLIVGFARRNFTDEQFRELMKQALLKFSRKKYKEAIWNKMKNNIFYQQGFFEERAPYNSLIPRLEEFDKKLGACITRFFYLATPPVNYSIILNHLSKTKLSEGCGFPFAPTFAKATVGKKATGDKQGFTRKWTRVLIEKPFGKDLNEARKLEEQLSQIFEEKQIYRIDHYLAKETVQNILAFRFANQIENLWNRDFIDHVQITLAESQGVGRRGKFYEGVGALKDVGQNHLMAMLAYIAMEEPDTMTAGDTRARRIEVLEKIRCMDEKTAVIDIVRGQYDKGEINGKIITAYQEEKDVDPKSVTETFIAMKLFIDNKRWQGVPFYLRSGKRLKETVTRIDIKFKNRKSKLFQQFHLKDNKQAEVLTIRIQPREGISLKIFTKTPGFIYDLEPVVMNFSYLQRYKKEIADSYEKILLDSMYADQTLFATNKGFEATWQFITSITKVWDKLPSPNFPNYFPGSWGPKESFDLIERDGRKWMA